MSMRYAVIGWPLGHSLSPLIHNASFKALGRDYAMEAVPISPALLDRFMNTDARAYHGIAVTIPYKSEILRFCKEISEEAAAIGAANTLALTPPGDWHAYNTDAVAVGLSFARAGVELRGKRVLVLGAGGAARAACFQVLLDGAARLTIANRTGGRAETLKSNLLRRFEGAEINTAGLDEDALRTAIGSAEVLINTTSIGMHPRTGESPVPPGILNGGLIVFDAVYNPLETRLLRDAAGAGAKTISGAEMLVYQAVGQEKIWMGADAPADLMREALIKRLGQAP